MFANLDLHDVIAGAVAIILTVGTIAIVATGGAVPEFLVGADGLAFGYVFRGAVAAKA